MYIYGLFVILNVYVWIYIYVLHSIQTEKYQRTYYLRTNNSIDKDEWMKDIAAALKGEL